MEQGETLEEGAARETLSSVSHQTANPCSEESGADVEVTKLVGMYDLLGPSQVLIVFQGNMKSGAHSSGTRSPT